MTSPEGMAFTALAALAGTVLKDWYTERKARKAIVQLFQECFVDEKGLIKTDRQQIVVAGLNFRLVAEKSSVRIGRGYEVMVINSRLPGDDHRRRRSFRYWDRPMVRLPHLVMVTWPPMYYQVQYYRR